MFDKRNVLLGRWGFETSSNTPPVVVLCGRHGIGRHTSNKTIKIDCFICLNDDDCLKLRQLLRLNWALRWKKWRLLSWEHVWAVPRVKISICWCKNWVMEVFFFFFNLIEFKLLFFVLFRWRECCVDFWQWNFVFKFNAFERWSFARCKFLFLFFPIKLNCKKTKQNIRLMKVKLLVSKLRVHKGLIVLSCDTRTDLDLTLFALHPTVVQLHTPTIDQLKLLFKSMLVWLISKKNI